MITGDQNHEQRGFDVLVFWK